MMQRIASRLLAVTILFGCLLAGTVGAAATAGGAAPSAQVKNGGTLTVSLAEDPDALDPTLARTFVGRIVFMHICEKLYDINAGAQIVPQLAAAMPKVSADKRTVTIRLRRGIKFNDGTAFNAQAVKVSLDRHRTLPRSARASELSPVSSVTTSGAYTVVIHLSDPYAPLTAQLADRSGMVMSPKQLDALGDRFATNPVCVGPFQFVSRTAGDRIVLKKSSFYYGKSRVHLNGLVFRIITDPASAAANLKSGDTQVQDRIASTELQGIARNKNLRIIKATSLGYQGITINIGNKNGLGKGYSNVGTALAAHPGLRQAFELAIDRSVINRVVFGGTVLPGCTPIPPSSAWFDRSIKCPKRNLNRAKQLVRQSGVSNPSVRLMIGTDSVARRLGQVIQAEEEQAGFRITLEPTEFVTSLAKADAGNFDAFVIGWSGRVDPDGNIYQFVATKGSQNDSGYSRGKLDIILNNARKASNPAVRKRLYHLAEQIIVTDRPLIYLYHTVTRDGVAKRVKGVRLYGDGLIRAQFAEFTS
jgi:peptide/nickel transport system substrate-binding protein